MRRLERSVLLAGVVLLVSACGKKGPLIYPDMLAPAAPTAVSAWQSGDAVKLQFVLPDKDRGGRSITNVAGVKISRRVTSSDTCRLCMTDYSLFKTLYLDKLPTTSQRFGGRLVMLDSDVNSGKVYSYSVASFTGDSVEGTVSLPVDVRMDVPFSAPSLKVEPLTTEVKIYFSGVPGLPAHLLGYNLYRSTGTAVRSYLPLNREPLLGNEYVDTGLDRGVRYYYSASMVIQSGTGDVVEGAKSEEVVGILKDDE